MPKFTQVTYRQVFDYIEVKARAEKIAETTHATGFTAKCDFAHIPDPQEFSITADPKNSRVFNCRYEWVVQGSSVVVELSIGNLIRNLSINYTLHYGGSTSTLNIFDKDTFDYSDEDKFNLFVEKFKRLQEPKSVSSQTVVKEDLYRKIRSFIDKWQTKDLCSYASLMKAKTLLASVNDEWAFNDLPDSSKVFHIEHGGGWSDPTVGLTMEWRNKETDSYLLVMATNGGQYMIKRYVGAKYQKLDIRDPIDHILDILSDIYEPPVKKVLDT